MTSEFHNILLGVGLHVVFVLVTCICPVNVLVRLIGSY